MEEYIQISSRDPEPGQKGFDPIYRNSVQWFAKNSDKLHAYDLGHWLYPGGIPVPRGIIQLERDRVEEYGELLSGDVWSELSGIYGFGPWKTFMEQRRLPAAQAQGLARSTLVMSNHGHRWLPQIIYSGHWDGDDFLAGEEIHLGPSCEVGDYRLPKECSTSFWENQNIERRVEAMYLEGAREGIGDIIKTLSNKPEHSFYAGLLERSVDEMLHGYFTRWAGAIEQDRRKEAATLMDRVPSSKYQPIYRLLSEYQTSPDGQAAKALELLGSQ